MLRKSALNTLRNDFLVPLLAGHFKEGGFKYVKKDGGFTRKSGVLNETVRLFTDARVPLHFDDKTGTLYLRFKLSNTLTSPKLEKWLKEKVGRGTFHRHLDGRVLGQVPVDMSRFAESDFYEPGRAQQFKNLVYASLRGPDRETYISFEDVLQKLPLLFSELRDHADPLKLFENWQGHNYWQHVYLLIFSGHTKRARAEFQIKMNAVYEALAGDLDSEKRKEYLGTLTKWQQEIKVFFGEDIDSPPQAEIRVTENCGTQFRLANDLAYAEHLRLDVSLTGAINHHLSTAGAITVLSDDLLLRRFSSGGELLLEHQISTPPGEVSPYWKNVAFSVIRGRDAIHVNNLVLTDDNRVVQLTYEKEERQGSAQPFVRIYGVSPDPDGDGYVMLYSTYNKRCKLSRYDSNGRLLGTILIEENPIAINPRRREIITWATNLGKAIYGFDGGLKYRFKCSDDKVVFSPNGQLAFFYGYYTKSTLLDLASGNKITIWGHPTYLKGYAATFYGDIEHNFGIDTAAFTPDGKYLIGGAYHGKYAVWDTEKWQRRELIPNPAHRKQLMSKLGTVFTNGAKEEYGFLPYVQLHEGQEIYVSRGNSLRSLYFVEQGRYTVGQIGTKLICWDDKFTDTGLININGKMSLNTGYALMRTKDHLVLFKRLKVIPPEFKSSVFVKSNAPTPPSGTKGRWLISSERTT